MKLLHLNDSKTPVGSRVDRHWHIGEGFIGREGFRNIVNHPTLSRFPGIMETPHKKEEDDVRNMSEIESLVIPRLRPSEKREEEKMSDCLSQGE